MRKQSLTECLKNGLSYMKAFTYFILDVWGYWLVKLLGSPFYRKSKYKGTIADISFITEIGEIKPDEEESMLQYPIYANWYNLIDHNPCSGDKVAYNLYRGRAIHIEIYERKNIYQNWMWCVKCLKYVSYGESIKKNEERSDWGGHYYFYCPQCQKELRLGNIHRPFQLHKIYEIYNKGALDEKASVEFANALNNPELMTSFMKRFTRDLP